MANKFSVVRITHEFPAVELGLGDEPDSNPSTGISKLINFLAGVLCGSRHAKLEVVGEATQASVGLAFGTTDGNVTINGVALAYTGGSAAARAANAVSVINASANELVKEFVTAVDDGDGTITLTAGTRAIGRSGNAITIAISGTGASVEGGGARLAGGTETKRTWKAGY